MLVLTGPIVGGIIGHSHHVNDWTTPLFPPPHQTSHDSEWYCATLFESHHLATTIPSSQNQDATLFLPSDDTTSLLHDVDYFALSELATTTGWDGLEKANLDALDTFEKTFGSYLNPK